MTVDSPHTHAGQRRRGSRLVVRHMPMQLNQNFVTRLRLGPNPGLIRLRAGTAKDSRRFLLLFAAVGFQSIDGRIFANHIVSQLGLHHRLFHGRGRFCERITA